MTRLTPTTILALAVLLAGCSTAAGPTPTPQERTVIVERTAPTPEVVERTVIHEVNRTVIIYENRTVTVIKPSPTRFPSPTALPSPTRYPSPTALPSPTPKVITKTVVVTKTVEVTPEPTATATPEPPEDSDIVINHSSTYEDGTYTLDVLAQNWYDAPVDLTLGVVLYDHHRRDTSVYSETLRNTHVEGTGGQWWFTVTYDGANASDVERAEVFVVEVERA